MDEELTPAQAAVVIGVAVSRMQQLCRAYQHNPETGLRCRVIGAELGPRRASYRIARADAEAYRDRGVVRGWPRGKPRKESAVPNE